MVSYAVFGLGLMGEAICYDLLKHDDSCSVVGIELNKTRIDELTDRFQNFNTRIKIFNYALGDNDTEINQLLAGCDVAFGSIDYKFNFKLSEMCIESNTHFLDLGGNPDIVAKQKELHEKADQKEILIVPDCGLAPGMANIIAYDLIQKFDEPDECHIRVGGLPHEPKGILNYQQVFSIRGLTNEYIEDAIVIRKRERTTVPSLTEVETLGFVPPFDRLEAFQTAGGTSSLPEIFVGKINELTYKTIRYEGHVQFFQFLMEYNLLSDHNLVRDTQYTIREIIEDHLVEYLPEFSPDVVLVRVFASGIIDGEYRTKQLDLIDYYNEKTNFSAMARTTAYPISIIGQLIIKNQLNYSSGVYTGEILVPATIFKEELAKREIVFKEVA